MNKKCTMGLAEIIALTFVVIITIIAIIIMTRGDLLGYVAELFN